MESRGSVTHWVGQLQAGDQAAAQPLWDRYIRRLVGLARKKLHSAPHRVADEEDVALSAFESFCRHAAEGRFPQLNDRDNLWQLLVVMTARKAHHLIRDERRQKRGGETSSNASRLRADEADPQNILGASPAPSSLPR